MKTINTLSLIAVLGVASSWADAARSMRFSDVEVMLAKMPMNGQTVSVSKSPSIASRLQILAQNKAWQVQSLFPSSVNMTPKSQVKTEVIVSTPTTLTIPTTPTTASSRFGTGQFRTLDAAKVKLLQNQLSNIHTPPANASPISPVSSSASSVTGVAGALKSSVTLAKVPAANAHSTQMGVVPYDREVGKNEAFQHQNPYQVIEQAQAGRLNNRVQNMYGESETPTLSVMSRQQKSKARTAYRRVVQAPLASYTPMPVNPAANRMQAPVPQGFAPQNDGVRQWIIYPNDGTIFASLSRWAKDAGWQVSWEAPMDFPVTLSAGFQGTFGEAIEGVMRSLSQSDFPLQACLYEGNRVVRVMRLVTNSRSCE